MIALPCSKADWAVALEEAEIDVTAASVALALHRFMDPAGVCYPSKGKIRRLTKFSDVRTVDRAVARLAAAGWIEVERSVGRRSNTYRATLPTPALQPGYGEGNPGWGGGQPRLGRRPTPAGEPGEVVEVKEEDAGEVAPWLAAARERIAAIAAARDGSEAAA